MRRTSVLAGLVSFLGKAAVLSASTADKTNLLYIIVDDLTANIKAFGGEYDIPTPNLDRLLQSGIHFTRTYTQFAVCSPSRNSFLSGLAPDTTKAYTFTTNFRTLYPNQTSLPGLFKANGYTTCGSGKIYHSEGPDPAKFQPPFNDEPYSWSQDCEYVQPTVDACPSTNNNTYGYWCAFDTTPDEDNLNYTDAKTANAALANIALLANGSTPWAIFAGFRKPHLPFYVPQRYVDEQIALADIPLPIEREFPTDGSVPIVAWLNSTVIELRAGPKQSPDDSLSDDFLRALRRHYWSGVSYTDHQIGRLLDQLETTQQVDNTIVIFHADHGYQLGEKGIITKQTNFELATRVPLVVRVPGLPQSSGSENDGLVELLDIYPTVADLFNLTAPSNLDGKSIKQLISEPGPLDYTNFTYARSQHTRCLSTDPTVASGKGPIPSYIFGGCELFNNSDILVLGQSIRTDEYRYTEWLPFNGTSEKPVWNGTSYGIEIYAHKESAYHQSGYDEYQNLANSDGLAASIKTKLAQLLRKAFDAPTDAPLPKY